MQRRQFGQTDLQTTLIGFGAWAIGGTGWRAAWGPQDDNESVAAIHAALERGINWIDTAAVYGLGHSEEVVGRALKGRSDRPYVFTKCSRVPDRDGNIQGNLTAASIRRELDASRKRLDQDVIDLYQIHWPNPGEGIEEGWTTLAELQAEGKVRYIGVSNFSLTQLQRAQAIAPVNSLQPPYSLLRRGIEADILPYCHANGIAVIAYSPMQSGLLSGAMTRERISKLPTDDWRRNDQRFQEPALSRALGLVDILRRIGDRQDAAPGAVAIAWTLRHRAITAAIVGARRPEQIDDIVKAVNVELTETDVEEIEDYLQTHP